MKRRDKPNLRLRRSQSGQAFVEYAVLLALVAFAVIGAVMLSQSSVNTAFNNAKDSVAGGGANITVEAGNPIGGAQSLPTAQPKPTNTPIPPTNTPLPPTNTPAPTNTATAIPTPNGATQTASAGGTATAMTVKTATAGAKNTATASYWQQQTAAVVATMTANANSSALRYGVNQYGWTDPATNDGFCGSGAVTQSGNNGLTKVNVTGNAGDVVCFRIDTYVGSNTSKSFATIEVKDSSMNSYFQLSTSVLNSKNFQSNPSTTATYDPGSNPANYAAIYVLVKMPPDVCTAGNNAYSTRIQSRDKSAGQGNADGVQVDFTCKNPPTATPTPSPTNTIGPSPTPKPPTATPTPLPTPTPAQGGS